MTLTSAPVTSASRLPVQHVRTGVSICILLQAGLSLMRSLVPGASVLGWVVALHAVVLCLGLASRRVGPGMTLLLIVQSVSGVTAPTLEQYLGESAGLAHPASNGSTVRAALLQTCFTAVMVLGSALFARASVQPPAHPRGSIDDRAVAWSMILLGLVGLALRFPSPGRVAAFLSANYSDIALAPGGLYGLVSSFSRPLLAAGLFVLWVGTPQGNTRPRFVVACLAPLAALGMMSFALNRAAVIIPLVAMALALYGAQRRLRPGRTFLLASLLGVAFVALGQQRQVVLGQGYEAQQLPLWQGILSSVHVYGQSPALTGYVLDTAAPYSPMSLIRSLMSAVPGAGEVTRSGSGTALYNYSIYGQGSTVRDQILPTWLEVTQSLGGWALIPWGLFVAWAMSRLDTRITSQLRPVARYFYALTAVWLAQVGTVSLTVLSQVTIYSLIPVLVISQVIRDRKDIAL